MNIKWRLALKLATGLLVVGAVLLVLAGFILKWGTDNMSRLEATRQFESAGLYQLIQTLQQEDGIIRFDPELLAMVRDSGGWLQRIDEEGKVIDSYLVPPDVPSSYGPGELTAYWLGRTPFSYQLYLWIQDKKGVTHTLLYGQRNDDALLLKEIAESAKQNNGNLELPSKLARTLTESRSWLQLLDEEGKQIAAFNAPEGAVAQFTLQEMALRSVYFDQYGTRLMTQYEPDSGLTWVLSTALDNMEPGQKPLIQPDFAILMSTTGMLIASSMVVYAVFAWWFGQHSGVPILHMMNWLKALGGGSYAEPTGSNGRPRSTGADGKRRRRYRLYGDVMDSLESLTRTLIRDTKAREETEKTRNEWIAGVSHDLKTPLSSIKGYAHLLENPAYEWSAEEVRSFARIMLDKSTHMEGLIGDLALAYQLRSGAVPPSLDEVELNAYIPETLYGAEITPDNLASRILFLPAEEPVKLYVYKPWFQRIVDNLTANAFLHNSKSTTLTVSVSVSDSGEIMIVFADNGEGMDEETRERLFERYYRGTDTESSPEGTGLGMAVTKALVEAFDGTITVESVKNKGTAITLTWLNNRGR
ncbi:sensor histidine kinase [Paenibacillus sp. CAU 1782]